MLNLVLFGPPGSGKGTQAEFLKKNYQLVHISTGDMLRKEIQEKTELGLAAKSLMDKGILVSDEIMIGMINSILEKNNSAKGIIFDGFPRTLAQAQSLDNLLTSKNTKIYKCLMLEVSEAELKKRLALRGATSSRPDDRDEKVIANRIQVYRSQTFPVAEYYNQQQKLIKIQGEGSIASISAHLKTAIDKQ